MTKMPQHALLTELTGCCQLTDGMAGWVREHDVPLRLMLSLWSTVMTRDTRFTYDRRY